MNRRGFLTGLLAAPAVITTPGLLMPVRAWAEPPMFVDCTFSGAMPVFIGDGIHDDTAAVQAAIDGLPFDAPHGGMHRVGHTLIFGATVIRVTDSIQMSGESLGISGGRWDGTALTDRALFNFQDRRQL